MTGFDAAALGRLRLADALTLTRLPLAAAVWWNPWDRWLLLGLVATAGITDVLDGWVARRVARREGRPVGGGWGDWLDPLCDKTFVLSAVGAVWVAVRPPAWLLLALITREALLALAWGIWKAVPRLRREVEASMRAGPPGKLTTLAQFLFLLLLLVEAPFAPVVAGVAAGAGAVTAIHHVRLALERRTSAQESARPVTPSQAPDRSGGDPGLPAPPGPPHPP